MHSCVFLTQQHTKRCSHTGFWFWTMTHCTYSNCAKYTWTFPNLNLSCHYSTFEGQCNILYRTLSKCWNENTETKQPLNKVMGQEGQVFRVHCLHPSKGQETLLWPQKYTYSLQMMEIIWRRKEGGYLWQTLTFMNKVQGCQTTYQLQHQSILWLLLLWRLSCDQMTHV